MYMYIYVYVTQSRQMSISSSHVCALSDLPRPRKRLTELMLKTALDVPGEAEQERRKKASRSWGFRFFRSPVEILADADHTRTAGIRLAVNRLEVNGGLDFKTQECGNAQLLITLVWLKPVTSV